MNIKEKYLPIGTVVLLAGGKKKLMIIGYCPVTEDQQTYDYMACLFPEGVLSPKDCLLFNHEQIVKVFYNGYVDEEQVGFIRQVKMLVDKKSGNNVSNQAAINNTPQILPDEPVDFVIQEPEVPNNSIYYEE